MTETLLLRNAYETPDKRYDEDLVANDSYVDSLPDLQDKEFIGAAVDIPHVGIHNFRLPLKIRTKSVENELSADENNYITVEASVTGTVSLGADKKGINMSRIIRTFYEHSVGDFKLAMFEQVLFDIMRKSECDDGYLIIRFNYPIKQSSLRSGMEGYQFYEVAYKIEANKDNRANHVIDFDFVYSSACPCSYELSEHARMYRNKAVVPHSQRSVARLSLLLDNNYPHIWLEDIQQLCVDALHTETQVMVKRQDEQAFAELNGSNTKFVEDAARQLYKVFDCKRSIRDFRILCSHLESLHSHDAVALVTKGNYFSTDISYHELRSLVK